MMTYLRVQLARLRRDEAAQTLVEYALLAFFLTITAVIFLTAIGLDLAETFDTLENALGLGAPNALGSTGVSDAATANGVAN
jgi:Flp pilus assembly pilin Flp